MARRVRSPAAGLPANQHGHSAWGDGLLSAAHGRSWCFHSHAVGLRLTGTVTGSRTVSNSARYNQFKSPALWHGPARAATRCVRVTVQPGRACPQAPGPGPSRHGPCPGESESWESESVARAARGAPPPGVPAALASTACRAGAKPRLSDRCLARAGPADRPEHHHPIPRPERSQYPPPCANRRGSAVRAHAHAKSDAVCRRARGMTSLMRRICAVPVLALGKRASEFARVA